MLANFIANAKANFMDFDILTAVGTSYKNNEPFEGLRFRIIVSSRMNRMEFNGPVYMEIIVCWGSCMKAV